MITRDFDGPWAATCEGAPPPLDVASDNPQARWCPLPRPVTFATPPGPVGVLATNGPPVGDDPTDPGNQTKRRFPTFGMIGRAEVTGMPAQLAAAGNVTVGGVRLR